MSHDPTSMNRAELQAYVAELLAAHDMHVGIVADLRSDIAAAKEREAGLVRELEAFRAMQHLPDLYTDLARELYKAVEKHTDEPDILSIIGSWRDTLSDADILQMMRDYNQTGKALSDAKPN